MQTKMKGLWDKVKGFFAKLNKKIRILLGVCAAVILIVIAAAAILLNQKDYAVLYTGLNATETSTIVQYLSDSGITDYRIQGDSILVPAGREVQLQAQLALAGYPTSGFLYEYYTDNIGSISTSDERDKAWLISINQRLGAIIRQFDGVQAAWVEIDPGTEQRYVLDPTTAAATASVTITPDGTKQLDSNVANAIRLLVSRSVKNLDISNVGLLDTLGNNYSDTTAMDSMSDANALKLQVEQSTNNEVRTSILQALGPIYGTDNVTVSVRSTANVDRRVIEKTEFSQPAGSVEGGGLIGRESWFWEYINDGTEPVGGIVGTTENSDIPLVNELEPTLDGNESYVGAQGDREGNLNTTVTQQEGLAATIVDVSIGVTINANCANAGSLSPEAVRSHVATVAGIRSEELENYVSVVIAPFDNTVPYTPSNPFDGQLLPGVPNLILYAAVAGLLLFIILLIIILILRSRAKKKRLAQQQAMEEEMQAAEALAAAAMAAEVPAATGGADIMEINTEKSMELRKTVRQFAQNNPEIAAQMVRTWLKGGEEDNG